MLTLYGLVSYMIHRLLLRVKVWAFIVICLGYAILTNYFFDLIIYAHQVLRSKGIYLEFGHADLELLEVFGICILMAFVNVSIAIFRKYKGKAKIG